MSFPFSFNINTDYFFWLDSIKVLSLDSPSSETGMYTVFFPFSRLVAFILPSLF